MTWIGIPISILRPGGKLHTVGVASQVKATVFPLIAGEKSIGGSPMGGPAEILLMLDFCSHRAIEPIIEEFPLSRVNEALAHLESGKARCRIVLWNVSNSLNEQKFSGSLPTTLLLDSPEHH